MPPPPIPAAAMQYVPVLKVMREHPAYSRVVDERDAFNVSFPPDGSLVEELWEDDERLVCVQPDTEAFGELVPTASGGCELAVTMYLNLRLSTHQRWRQYCMEARTYSEVLKFRHHLCRLWPAAAAAVPPLPVFRPTVGNSFLGARMVMRFVLWAAGYEGFRRTEADRRRLNALLRELFSRHAPAYREKADEAPGLDRFSDENFRGDVRVTDGLLKMVKFLEDRAGNDGSVVRRLAELKLEGIGLQEAPLMLMMDFCQRTGQDQNMLFMQFALGLAEDPRDREAIQNDLSRYEG